MAGHWIIERYWVPFRMRTWKNNNRYQSGQTWTIVNCPTATLGTFSGMCKPRKRFAWAKSWRLSLDIMGEATSPNLRRFLFVTSSLDRPLAKVDMMDILSLQVVSPTFLRSVDRYQPYLTSCSSDWPFLLVDCCLYYEPVINQYCCYFVHRFSDNFQSAGLRTRACNCWWFIRRTTRMVESQLLKEGDTLIQQQVSFGCL